MYQKILNKDEENTIQIMIVDLGNFKNSVKLFLLYNV